MRVAAVLILASLFFSSGLPAQTVTEIDPAEVDAVFARFDVPDGPGCTVGVSRAGEPVLLRAYGMADLEHGVANTPATILEPGSVAKQFTAAATVLLALDGALSLDDDIRKWFPELPDYGAPVTVRHLLTHTSGLRDWGVVAGITGWPRTTRVHTHAHVLDIVSRQSALNYVPGDYYSYTNTGYNLLAMLVERAGGMSFADFSDQRIFGPLGMAHTRWRDDFREVVPNRAVAYSPGPDGTYRQNMPFEDVHGNGGLLTTVEDLLRFTHALETGELGGDRFIEEMHRQGVLNDGFAIAYASGLQVGSYRGVRQVQHSGSTAGYRGHLARFPDHELAIATMCNLSTANASSLLYEVADLYLADAIAGAEPAPPTYTEAPAASLAALEGTWRDVKDGSPVRVRIEDGAVRVGGGAFRPVGTDRFADGDRILTVQRGEAAGPRLHITSNMGPTVLESVPSWDPAPADLAAFTGVWTAPDAEVTYRVEVRDDGLVAVERYGDESLLRPAYPDAFSGPGGTWIFHRQAGRVTGLSLVNGRVWDLRFHREGPR